VRTLTNEEMITRRRKGYVHADLRMLTSESADLMDELTEHDINLRRNAQLRQRVTSKLGIGEVASVSTMFANLRGAMKNLAEANLVDTSRVNIDAMISKIQKLPDFLIKVKRQQGHDAFREVKAAITAFKNLNDPASSRVLMYKTGLTRDELNLMGKMNAYTNSANLTENQRAALRMFKNKSPGSILDGLTSMFAAGSMEAYSQKGQAETAEVFGALRRNMAEHADRPSFFRSMTEDGVRVMSHSKFGKWAMAGGAIMAAMTIFNPNQLSGGISNLGIDLGDMPGRGGELDDIGGPETLTSQLKTLPVPTFRFRNKARVTMYNPTTADKIIASANYAPSDLQYGSNNPGTLKYNKSRATVVRNNHATRNRLYRNDIYRKSNKVLEGH